MPTPTIYPFDPYGTEVSNLIQNERHAISPPAWADYYFIIPKLAPFFRDSLKIIHEQTGKELKEGVDWVATHLFRDASRASTKPIFGSITFYDKTLSGVVRLEYQTLGGEWVIDTDTIAEILANNKLNPRITTWEQVVNVPDRFPVIDHEWHLDDLVGMSEVHDAIVRISEVILATGDPNISINDHLNRDDNPHSVTKDQVGLDKVMNFPIATRTQAEAGLDDTAYMTPIKVKQAIEKLAHTYTDTHEKRKDNPHEVTKTQVGLSAVQNYAVSTKSEAVAGESHQRYMTPLRVKEAIAAQVANGFIEHRDNKSNPHQVSKDQIGLNQVENYRIATREEAEKGESNQFYMTPLRVKEAIAKLSSTELSSHRSDRDNPHEVTKAQVGLGQVANLPLASQLAAESGTSDAHYMTPLRVKQAIAKIGYAYTDAHERRTDNPHKVTIEQVDGYSKAAIDQMVTDLGGGFDSGVTTLDGLELPTIEPPSTQYDGVTLFMGGSGFAYADITGDANVFRVNGVNSSDLENRIVESIALADGAAYYVTIEGTVTPLGPSALPVVDDANRIFVDVKTTSRAVYIQDDTGGLLTYGDPVITAEQSKDVGEVYAGSGNNVILKMKSGELVPVGDAGFVSEVTPILTPISFGVSNIAIGKKGFVIHFTDGSVRVFEIQNPDTTPTVVEADNSFVTGSVKEVSGWGNHFVILNRSNEAFLWDLDTARGNLVLPGNVDNEEILSVGASYDIVTVMFRSGPVTTVREVSP